MRRFVIILGALLLCARLAEAAPFVIGDVLASTGSGTVLQYRGGVLIDTLPAGSEFVTGGAFDAALNFYVTQFSEGRILRYDANSVPQADFAAGLGVSPESLSFDAAGNLFVGTVNGHNDILKYSSAGVLLDQFDVGTQNRGSDWIDLAADQQTMFYTSEGSRVLRYDVLTDTQLADFAVVGDTLWAQRLLGDGLLVAGTSQIYRLDSTGAVIQTYDDALNGWFALNLDPDNTTFWSATTSGNIRRWDIATGALIAGSSIDTGSVGGVWGLTVAGEIRQADPDPDPQPVPEPATLLLVGMGIVAAGHRLHRRSAR